MFVEIDSAWGQIKVFLTLQRMTKAAKTVRTQEAPEVELQETRKAPWWEIALIFGTGLVLFILYM